MPLVPSYIKKLSSYKPGKPIEEVERELGIRNIIKLASNENPLGPSPKAINSLFDEENSIFEPSPCLDSPKTSSIFLNSLFSKE